MPKRKTQHYVETRRNAVAYDQSLVATATACAIGLVPHPLQLSQQYIVEE